MSILKVIILALVQGLAELLPVSSSAHVVVAEKLMGLDASSPQMTLLLVMLHTGTMFAVIAYFWTQWKKTYFSSGDAFKRFLGFSRSGATISSGMLTGASKERAERFSFALAVVLTPPAVGREVLRLVKASHEATAAGAPIDLHGSMVTGLLGAFFAFLAGLVALKWLSSWLEEGRWYLFGIYCLIASVGV